MSVKISITKLGRAFNKRCVTEYGVKPAIAQTLKDGIYILRFFTPIDTGLARSGWETNNNLRFIQNEVPYVKFLDEGTVKMKAFNITKQAIPRIKEEFKRNIENAIRKNLE
jgi:hypothetical protein